MLIESTSNRSETPTYDGYDASSGTGRAAATGDASASGGPVDVVEQPEVTTLDFDTGDTVVGRGARDRRTGSRVVAEAYDEQARTAKTLAESPDSTADEIIAVAGKTAEIAHLTAAGVEMGVFGAKALHAFEALGAGGTVASSAVLPAAALGALLTELGEIHEDIKAVGNERPYADSFSDGYAAALVLTDDGASLEQKQQAYGYVKGYAKTHGKDQGAAFLVGYQQALKLSPKEQEAARGELARLDAGSTKWGSGLGTSSSYAINQNYKFGAYSYAMMGVWESKRY